MIIKHTAYYRDTTIYIRIELGFKVTEKNDSSHKPILRTQVGLKFITWV